MLKDAVRKILPLFLAAVTAISSVGVPVHAEETPEKAKISESENLEMVSGNTEQEVERNDEKQIISLSQTVDGVRVRVSAEPGVIAEGTQLRVTKIEGVEALELTGTVTDKVIEEGAADASGLLALDISLVDADGNKYDPNENVTVSFEEIAADLYEMSESESLEVYHFPDGDLSRIEDMSAVTEGGTVSFETDSFSPFVVIRAAATDADRYHPDVPYLKADESTGGKYFA